MENGVEETEPKIRIKSVFDSLFEWVPERARLHGILVRHDFVRVRVSWHIHITDDTETVEAAEVIVGESKKSGFQAVKYEENLDGSNTLVLERWNTTKI